LRPNTEGASGLTDFNVSGVHASENEWAYTNRGEMQRDSAHNDAILMCIVVSGLGAAIAMVVLPSEPFRQRGLARGTVGLINPPTAPAPATSPPTSTSTAWEADVGTSLIQPANVVGSDGQYHGRGAVAVGGLASNTPSADVGRSTGMIGQHETHLYHIY
jgi:hypothetical protein